MKKCGFSQNHIFLWLFCCSKLQEKDEYHNNVHKLVFTRMSSSFLTQFDAHEE